jgi:hypothetical protein
MKWRPRGPLAVGLRGRGESAAVGYGSVVSSRGGPASTYVSPAAWAREVVTRVHLGKDPQVSKKSVHTAKRIHGLMSTLRTELEAQRAPLHVFRWVAWARKRSLTDQRRRADLVLHLRRTFERPADGWFLEREHQAAFDVWMRAIEEARNGGLLQPRVDQIPAERYAEALAAAETASARAPSPLAKALGDEATLRALARKIAEQLGSRSS